MNDLLLLLLDDLLRLGRVLALEHILSLGCSKERCSQEDEELHAARDSVGVLLRVWLEKSTSEREFLKRQQTGTSFAKRVIRTRPLSTGAMHTCAVRGRANPSRDHRKTFVRYRQCVPCFRMLHKDPSYCVRATWQGSIVQSMMLFVGKP